MSAVKQSAERAQFLTVEEVADLLRQRPRTIYQWVADRRIPHYKPGRALLFDRSEIEGWVESHRRGAEKPLTPEGREAVSSGACR